MKKIAFYVRAGFFLGGLAVLAVGLTPKQAEALKSCEFYCGPAGPYTCVVTSTFICPREDWN